MGQGPGGNAGAGYGGKDHSLKIIDTSTLSPSSLTSSESLWVYNGLDTMVTAEVLEALLPQLNENTQQTYNFSRALQGPILEMNCRGILIDEDRRQTLLRTYYEDIIRLSDNLNRLIREGIGFQFEITRNRKNPWPSDHQLQTLFFDVMGFKEIRKRNAQGEMVRTVDRDALEKLEGNFYAEPIVRHLFALRELGKKCSFLNTSIDPDGRLRTSFNIAGTNTGRLASSFSDFGTGTNVQNIENRLRAIFITDPGYKFCNIDLEQSDARVVGAIHWNLFRDPHYLDLCESGDLHTGVARIAFRDLPWTQEPRSDRVIANGNFYREFSYRDAAKRLGHGCLTEDHEVLTRNGWVNITKKPTEIMSWSQDSSQFENVPHWEDKLYSGNLVTFDGNSISANMTADHRVPYRSDNRSTIRERPASTGPGLFMPLGDNYIGGTKEVPARLIAAFMADGSYEGASCRFHLIKERKIQRLQKLCKLYDFDFRSQSNDKYLFKGNLPKHPGPFMFDWTAKCIDDFLDELKFWDGHESETAVSISSTNRKDLEWFQILGRIRGIGGAIQHPQISGFGSIVYRLQQNHRKWASGQSIDWEVAHYNNVRVLCPTVPSSWFYVRRNGKIFVTGNTNYQGQPDKMSRATHIPKAAIVSFQQEYLSSFPSFPMWWEHTQNTLRDRGHITTFLGRQRCFFGHWKDPTTVREAVAFEPQSVTAETINRGLLNIWKAQKVQLLNQVHDSILFQFPEHLEAEIVPWALKQIEQTVHLKDGRDFLIPAEAKTGWNWSDDPTDPDSLKKWNPDASGRSLHRTRN